MIKKIVFSLMLILLFSYFASPQTYIVQAKLHDNDNWGYVNMKGEFIFETKFQKSNEFCKEGLAPVHISPGTLYYFINLKGQVLPVEVTGFRLYSAYYPDVPEGFHDGLARIFKDRKWGYLNTSGKVAIPIKYDNASIFSGGFAVAKIDGKIVILDKQYREHPVTDVTIDEIRLFTEDLAPFVSVNNLMGFVDYNGKIVIQPKFMSVGYFSADLAWVRKIDEMIGYVDKKGEWIIQPQFEVAKSFDSISGMARIRLNGKMGFTNKKGEILYVNDAEDFGDFSEGLCWGRKNNQVGFFNNKGEWIIPPQFLTARDFKNGYAAARISKKWGIIDKEGKWIIMPKFQGIKDMELIDQETIK
jgi:hypothetical protein